MRAGTVWTQQAKLTASDAAASDLFGIGVSISGDTLVAGARQADLAGGSNQGAAYVFLDADGDGVIDVLDACPNNSPGLAVDAAGRPLRDCNGDCLVNGLDAQCIANEMLNQ